MTGGTPTGRAFPGRPSVAKALVGKASVAKPLLFSAVFVLLVPAAVGAQKLVIVSGLGGAPVYTRSFAEWSTSLAQAAHDRGGLPDSAIVWLGEPAAPRSRWYRGQSNRENVERVLGAMAGSGARDALVLVLIGHGSGEGAQTRISLPGVDLTAADFSRLLARFDDRRLAFINLASASGDMLPVLAAPNRVVMTATKSAFERNESQFARYFVAAFAEDGSDVDKDGRVSLLEAFRFAEAETRRFYETDGRLATEHAQMADDGRLAQRFFFGGGATLATGANPRLSTLYARRDTLDAQIQVLKARRTSMTADTYDRELEQLFLSLARTSREIRRVERGGGDSRGRR